MIDTELQEIIDGIPDNVSDIMNFHISKFDNYKDSTELLYDLGVNIENKNVSALDTIFLAVSLYKIYAVKTGKFL